MQTLIQQDLGCVASARRHRFFTAAVLLMGLGACGPCKKSESQDAGPAAGRGINESCDANNACGSLGSVALTCVAGTCQRADCHSGVQGCPCGANNTCTTATNQCVGGTCVDPGCMVGTNGCPCDGTTCQNGLMCVANVCHAGGESGLTISGTEARGCDVVLSDPDNAVLAVRFASTVEGKWLRRNAKVATSFVNKSNAAFAGGAVTVDLAQGADPTHVTVVSGTCVGSDGHTLTATTVGIAH